MRNERSELVITLERSDCVLGTLNLLFNRHSWAQRSDFPSDSEADFCGLL